LEDGVGQRSQAQPPIRPDGTHIKAEALAAAYDVGVVCTDEYHLGDEPYPNREA
jgi:hypothetical protein